MRLAVVLIVLLGAPATTPWAFDHAAWDRIVRTYVDDAGRVAYADLRARDAAALDGYLEALGRAAPQEWPRDEQIAFWLNAYNAVIVRAVLDGYTPETLLSRLRLFQRYTRPVAGRARTPDDIEKRILHPLGEPRMHVALVCASSSCPRLRRPAWTAASLEQDLDEEARRFVRDPARNDLRPGAPAARLSMIFDWYAADFGGDPSAVRAWVARYADDAAGRWLTEARPVIEYLPYDWSLNAQPGQRPR